MKENIDERLDNVRELLKDPDFLEGNGLSNEVNIRMFCYEAKDEMRVRYFVEQIMADQTLPCHLKENNLYEVFLQCCEDKRILSRIADQSTIAKLTKGENVNTFVLLKICEALNCDTSDIAEVVPEETIEEGMEQV